MDDPIQQHILTINAGSSSIKFDVFEGIDKPTRLFSGTISNIGQPLAKFTGRGQAAATTFTKPVAAPTHAAGVDIFLDWLRDALPHTQLAGIGYRIVHGGPDYTRPCLIDEAMLAALDSLLLFDPEHVPVERELIEKLQAQFPKVPQIACFDTAFHHDLPRLAQLLPIPRKYEKLGLRRYGFHGLSYSFVQNALHDLIGAEKASGRFILAHLGSGVSLTALHHGKPVETSMGLTPTSGVPMSTRSGDIDPGLALFFMRNEGFSADQFSDMVNFKSGLLGVSDTTADMKTLLEREADEPQAKEAVDYFCYQISKTIGSLAAALGGLDGLVFTGGMGEQAPLVRARICQRLEFLGITLDPGRNDDNAVHIAHDTSAVGVYVIKTDEAVTIVREITSVLRAI